MLVSLLIVVFILFAVFMFTAEGVTDSAKNISVGIGVIFCIWLFIVSIF